MCIRDSLTAAYVNDHFRVHIFLAKETKNFISFLLSQSEYFFNLDQTRALEEHERLAVTRLREYFSENEIEWSLENFEKHLETLYVLTTDIIQDLTFQELNSPFTIMFVPPTIDLLKKIALALVSASGAVIQQQVQNLLRIAREKNIPINTDF
eukprot:TRINITY_DN10893_c0_g1_i1.p1 TRINITY_DN10893_c0_g1~~TRINITY_DN10893_c0_g1_i1.p1  ORF type:complete len:173 (-),score=59.41 TRINITY_DN10893_c0_g1_i1:102-560(-)